MENLFLELQGVARERVRAVQSREDLLQKILLAPT